MKLLELEKKLQQEQYILDGMRPTSKQYQVQYQKVKDIKTRIEFEEIQEQQSQNKKDNQ